MAAPNHHFMQNMNNPNASALRNSFGPAGLQNMDTSMPGVIANQMGAQMNPMMNTMGGGMSPINSQMNPMQAAGIPNQIMGQMAGAMSPITAPMCEFNTNLNQMNQMGHPGNQTPGVAPTPPQSHTPQQQQQSKEFNTASLCRLGQETVQDIFSRTQEVFQTLKTIQPPTSTAPPSNPLNDKKAKVQELLRTIRVLFKRLRLIYEKCNENCQIQGMEYTHIESLIPFKDELDPKHEEKKNSEAYRLAIDESKEVMEQVILKNKQLKEIIDHLRRIVWEINTMLTMKKS